MKYLAIQIYEDGSETEQAFDSLETAWEWLKDAWQFNEHMTACKIEQVWELHSL